MKKVKNVIKGYMSREDIDRITIINPNDECIALYSGIVESFLNPPELMKDFQREIMNMEVLKSAVDCGCQLFIIVKGE